MEIKQGGKAEALYARQHRVKEGEGEVSAPPAERTAWQEAFLCSENQFNT
jgi:hypothetical protein